MKIRMPMIEPANGQSAADFGEGMFCGLRWRVRSWAGTIRRGAFVQMNDGGLALENKRRRPG